MFQIPLKDPGVFFSGVPFPSDQERAGSWRSAVSDDLLDFIFLLSVDKVRGWYREVLSVYGILFVRGEKRSVEDQMNLPGLGKWSR